MGSLQGEPTLTYVLIGANVLAFLGSIATGGSLFSGGGTLAIDGALLGDGQGPLEGRGIVEGELWRIVTGGFLHAGLFHLFLNMFLLYMLGGLLEPVLGRLRFGVIYFVSLLSGSFGALLLTPEAFTRGASGAVFGLMGAAVVIMRARGMNPMESGIGPLILLNLVITFLLPGISIGGHVGGLAGGVLAAYLLYDLRDRARVPPTLATGLAAGVGLLAVIGSIAAAGG